MTPAMVSAPPRPASPRVWPLFIALLALVVLVAGVSRITGPQPGASIEPQAAITHRTLQFRDRADGAVIVSAINRNGAHEIRILAPGTHNFIRGVLRGLMRERKARRLGPDAPYRLVQWRDGRLSLEDPATGRHIALESFGPTNTAEFRELLAGKPAG